MEVKRDPLLWAALIAVLVVLASAEYRLAVACGFGQYVAAGVPAALDVYAIAALRARRDVLAVVAVLIGVNAASHLVEVGLLPVDVPLVVAVSAVAPLVLWRVHRLGEAGTSHSATTGEIPQSELSVIGAEPSTALPEPAEPVTVEREPAEQPPAAAAVPIAPVLAPWTPVAELAGGTVGTERGTGRDSLGDHFRTAARVITQAEAEQSAEPADGTGGTASGTGPDQAFPWHQEKGWAPVPTPGGTEAEPAPEPVPPAVPPTGTETEPVAADLASEDAANTTFKARVAAVRHWLKTEPELTGTEIGTRLHVSDGYGRRLLRAAREDT